MIVRFFVLVLAACAIATPPARAATGGDAKAQITVLYDAFGKVSGMQKDWGYAAFIEYGGKRMLFDTGNRPDMLEKNAKAKGVDLDNDVEVTRFDNSRNRVRSRGA